MRLAAVLSAALLLHLATPASAGGPPGTIAAEVPEPAAPTHVTRYGKQVALADLAWLGAMYLVGSVEARSNDGEPHLTSVLALGYFATGPIVHLRNGNRSGAGKSLAARALLPVGGMLVGGMLAAGAVDDASSEGDDLGNAFAVMGGMMLGAAAGTITAVVLDWTVFAKKTVEGRPARWAVMPNVTVTKHGALAGVGGQF